MTTLRTLVHLKHPYFNSPSSSHPFFIQNKSKSHQKCSRNEPSSTVIQNATNFHSAKSQLFRSKNTSFEKTHTDKPRNLKLMPGNSQKFSRNGFYVCEQGSNEKKSRVLVLVAVSIGVVMFLMCPGDEKALALGPEGPLMEEFWDNMRRYALYVLTVSTGFAYTVFQPIYELLKNPISAILILAIIAGSFYIVSQVLSTMVGVSDFSYDYSY